MRPRKPDGSAWCAEDANAMLQHIARIARDELNARDIARGLPKSLACGRFDRSGTFVVDPRLSALKHSGEEESNLVGERWRAFCAEPRDPQTELAGIGLTAAPEESSPMRGVGSAMAAAIEQGIARGIEAAMTRCNADKPRRRRKGAPVAATGDDNHD